MNRLNRKVRTIFFADLRRITHNPVNTVTPFRMAMNLSDNLINRLITNNQDIFLIFASGPKHFESLKNRHPENEQTNQIHHNENHNETAADRLQIKHKNDANQQ